MNKFYAITACFFMIAGSVKGQTSATMKWYQEPKKWSGTPRSLSVRVDSATDYWRITHYGFIRDNGPFYYYEATGDFEASVKVSGQYKELFHQAGLMVRIDNKNWIKTGIEYVDGVQNVSAVVTREVSDWSVVPRNDSPASIWLKLLRKGDYVEIRYSFDNKDFKMLRLAYFPPQVKAQIGIVAAAPGKLPFNVLFEDFEVKPVQ
jgi:regulation of enolase protein 1 (concanavalin A-like superfamily)